MTIGEQKANALENIGIEFEKFLKTVPKTKAKSMVRNAELLKAKTDGLKSICLKYGVEYQKVCKIYLSN